MSAVVGLGLLSVASIAACCKKCSASVLGCGSVLLSCCSLGGGSCFVRAVFVASDKWGVIDCDCWISPVDEFVCVGYA